MKPRKIYSKTIKVLLIIIVFIFFNNLNATADHLVGSDISYQCTSTPGVYKVILKIYRDCAGAQMCPGCGNNPGSIAGCTTANACCGFNNTIIGKDLSCSGVNFGSFTLTAVSATSGYDIIQTCTAVKTICTNCGSRTPGTYSPGIEVYTFEGNVNLNSLPNSCCKVSLGFSTCCRNIALNTISSAQYFTEAIVNRCQTPCNSAPTFTNDAAALVCSGVDFVYNLGAIDPDGDSLSYDFGESLIGSGSSVSYIVPYSAGYPFPYFGAPNRNAAPPAGLRIDPATGDVMFRPLGSFVAMLVIEVTQWKLINGVWTVVGLTRRDVQFQTKLCTSNKVPLVKIYRNGVLQTGVQSFTVCANTQICLDIVAEDQQDLAVSPQIQADTTDLKWNNPGLYNPVMANATFIANYIIGQRGIQGPKADSFRFCWTPPKSAARSLPHSFTVTGKDRFCPLPAFVTKGVNIRVIAVPEPIITVVDNKCGFRTFNFVLGNPSQTSLDATKSKWQIESFPNSGVYTVVNASPGAPPFPIYRHYFNQAGTFKYRLALNSVAPAPLGCPSLDSGTVVVGVPLDVTVRDTYNCVGSNVTLKARATGGTRIGNQAGYQFFQGGLASQTVIKGNLDPNVGTGITIDSFVTVSPSNIGNNTIFKVKVRDSDGCTDSATFNVLTRALPLRELTPNIRLCPGDDTSLFVGLNGTTPLLRSLWYQAPNLSTALDSQATYVINDVKASDSATYVLRKIDIHGCSTLDTTRLFINTPVAFTSPRDSTCQNDPAFPLRARFSTMYIDSFVWFNSTLSTRLAENDTLLLPTATAGTTQYILRGYYTYDGKTCYSDDSASLKINGLPNILNRPAAVPLCRDQGLYNLGGVQTSNPSTSQTVQVWSYPPNPLAITSGNVVRIDSLKYIPGSNYIGKAFGNYMYLSVKANTTGCFRYDSLLIGLFPVTPITLPNPPKMCDFDKPFSLSTLTTSYSSSGSSEIWYGRGLSFSPTTKYRFNPSDTSNADPLKSTRAGLSLATDSNILRYEFYLQFPPTVNVDFLPARTGNVSMSSPQGGCASSDTVIFRVTKSPKLRAGLLPTVCLGDDSVYISSRALAGTNSTTAANPATSYWYLQDRNIKAVARGQVFMPFHPDIVVPNDGQNPYTLIYADTATGCRAADTTDIRVNGIPEVNILTTPNSDSAVCKTQNRMFFSLTPNPEFLTPLDSISLTGAPNINAGIGNALAYLDINSNTGILEQVYNLKYYYRSPEGCKNEASRAIRVQFPPDVQLSKNGSACEYGGSFQIDILKSPSSTHPYGLTWSVIDGTGTIVSQDNSKLIYSPSAAEKAAGRVNVMIITNNNGLCAAASDTSVFVIHPKPSASFSGVDSGCVRAGIPLNINLVAGPNAVADCNYIWEVDGTVEADSINKTMFSKSFSTPKTYNMRLIVRNAITGCVDTSSSQTSTAWETPTADFNPDKTETTIARPYFSFTNASRPKANNSYFWRLGIDPVTSAPRTSVLVDPTDIAFAADTALIPITLIATSDKGCIDSITKYIRINPDIAVFIPNVFYPSTGGDSKTGSQMTDCMIEGVPCNRHFFLQATGYEQIEIYVYNRWGKLVFSTKNVKEGWDGTDTKSGGGDCQQDAYVYQIFATSFSGKKYQYSGSVTLLR